MKESGADSSNSDVVEAELVNACKTAVKKDEKFVSFTCRVLYHTYVYTSGHVNVMFSPYPHVFQVHITYCDSQTTLVQNQNVP